MLIKIVTSIAVVLGAFLVYVAVQPGDFTISRSSTVNASPADVFAQVNDFRRWEAWSPWAKLDPAMSSSYEGPVEGQGSSYSWSGDGKVGEGKMTMLESQAPEHIRIQLDFLKPMQATNLTEFTFKPEGEGTMVTWTMSGKRNFLAKAFCVFMDMEKMVGADFEKGLAQLKAQAEAAKS